MERVQPRQFCICLRTKDANQATKQSLRCSNPDDTAGRRYVEVVAITLALEDLEIVF
jgi:hypothetical protein